ncbi:hypothetical protein MTO96_039523, partial [Rhipicephalus appendiculatus]
GFVHAISDWCAKYGDVFGFYNGDLPMLVVKDLDFITYVFVKDFKNFTDRGVLMRTDQEHAVLSNSIVHAKGAEWKRTRSCMSQAFTSNKLKQMMQDLEESADLFVETLGEFADAGRELAIHKPLQGLAMDYTGRAGFRTRLLLSAESLASVHAGCTRGRTRRHDWTISHDRP